MPIAAQTWKHGAKRGKIEKGKPSQIRKEYGADDDGGDSAPVFAEINHQAVKRQPGAIRQSADGRA